MWVKRILTFALCIMMVSTGLVFVGVGDNPENDDALGNPVVETPRNTVQRKVLMEAFTNQLCGPCKTFCPMFSRAIENKSDVTAPAYVHVHWPGRNDPFNNHGNMPVDGDIRRTFYDRFTSVPKARMDGASTTCGGWQGYYEDLIDTSAAVPANVSITTTGYINPSTLLGTISVHAEAVENLPAGDYRMIVYIWEENVTRYTPLDYTDDWGVWYMLPSADGTPIWTGGATSGESVDLAYSFFCEPEWDLSEMGATVFIQSFDTKFVEQAEVDHFTGGLPTNDVLVMKNTVPLTFDIGESTLIRCDVHNAGTSVETNVEVKLLLNGAVEDTNIIPSIASNSFQTSSFFWNAPGSPGDYSLGFEVTPVGGETILGNNIWETPIEVFAWPNVWASPASLDFTVPQGQIDNDILNIGNNGDAILDFGMAFDAQEEFFPSHEWPRRGMYRDFGNVFNVTTDTTLYEIGVWLDAEISMELYFFVYECIEATRYEDVKGDYTKIAEKYIANGGAGNRYYYSGAMNVPLEAGKCYYIGADYDGGSSIYYDGYVTVLKHTATSFGFIECGLSSKAGNPPGQTFNNTSNSYIKDITIKTGPAQPSWLSLAPETGTVPISGQTPSTVSVDTSSLTPGSYQTDMMIFSNDPDTEITIPIDLTVTPAGPPYDIQISPSPTGWEFISFPIGVNGDVTTVLDDSINGDGQTDWDMVQWYDAQTQEWKTYATYKPASLNNMPDMDNTMGCWVHITANGGDNEITTGAGGAYSSTPVDIDLYTGWNLVGYPSATSRLASVTLPPQANVISVFDSGQPYGIRDETVLTGVTMTEGNAYWVHVTADCTWTVDP